MGLTTVNLSGVSGMSLAVRRGFVARRSMVMFSRRVGVVLAALALTVPVMAGRADADADVHADIYWSANPVTDHSVIGHIPRGTTTTNFLYTNLSGAQAVANDGAYVYWAVPNAIWRAPLDGSAAPQQFLTGLFSAQALAIDAPNELIYWADKFTNTIGRALLLQGATIQNGFINTLGVPNGLAVDSKNGYLYWARNSNGTIGRAKVTETPSIVVTPGYLSGLDGAQGIAVDGTYLYWANGASGIGRAPLDGSSPPNGRFIPNAAVSPHLAGDPDTTPTGMAVDSGYIYWANHRDYAVGQAPIGGGAPNNTFVRTLVDPTGITLQVQPASPGPLPPPPPPPPPNIPTLRTGVQILGLAHGIERSLLAKLDAGQQALDSGDEAGLCDSLTAFVNAVTAQRGKKIEEPSGAGLIDHATTLRQSLGCDVG